MKGFKDSTKTVWLAGGYAKGGRVNGAAKISKVMREFKSGELHSGAKDGPKVSSRKQAVAIALSEASGGKPVQKKSLGGVLEAGAGLISGGVTGLLKTLADQRRRKEWADAQQTAQQTPATAATLAQTKKPDDPTQPMRKGGAVRKAAAGEVKFVDTLADKRAMRRSRGPNEPLIQSNTPPRSLLDRKACGGLAAMPRMKR